MKYSNTVYGFKDGKEVIEYRLVNNQGNVFRCLNYGAVVTAIEIPDRSGQVENVVLGFDNLKDYIKDSPYFGAIVGRVAGRIKDGRWGELQLTKNEGQNHIHGGNQNFSQVVWDSEMITGADYTGVLFTHTSPADDNGYPGNLKVQVTYYWTNDNCWKMKIKAVTDETTLFNPTNHTYFNLSGNVKRTILDHTLQVSSDTFAETDREKCPTGRLLSVEGTPFDFRKPVRIGHAIHKQPSGYDTPFKLTSGFIQLFDDSSGRKLTIQTDREAVVVFSTTGMDEEYLVAGEKMSSHRGIALETQELPGAIHHSPFQSIVIHPGHTYTYQTEYHFSVEDSLS